MAGGSSAARTRRDRALAIARSASALRAPESDAVRRWLTAPGPASRMTADIVPLAALRGWRRDPATGDLHHESGRFFTVQGLTAEIPGAPVDRWSQPIISQPEIGVLGLLARESGGVLEFLMQLKREPGNHNGVQLAPTVQATRSNYTRVHGGRSVPFLEFFRDPPPHGLVADVRQSEQGAWFFRKRNRNMIVLTDGRVDPPAEFRWLTLGQVHRALAEDDLVNMDARTVLSCLPFAHAGLARELGAGSGFRGALARSCDEDEVSRHTTDDLLMWITDARTRHEVRTSRAPLDGLPHWRLTDEKISHESGLFFDVVGVDVRAGKREVLRWAQPMIRPHGEGVVAFLAKSIDGVLHVLAHARVEPGYVDVIELAPTVQCTPANLACLPAAARPPFLDEVLGAGPERIRYAAMLSEEGGRFHHARNRYLVVETDVEDAESGDYRWVALHQLAALVRHSHYVNVQARSLLACLHSLFGGSNRGDAALPT